MIPLPWVYLVLCVTLYVISCRHTSNNRPCPVLSKEIILSILFGYLSCKKKNVSPFLTFSLFGVIGADTDLCCIVDTGVGGDL